MAAELIEVAEARQRVLAAATPLAPERVALDQALGRTLAEAVRSDGDLPPFESSAMDGYAVVAGPAAELALVGESRAGRPAGLSVGPGEAVRISTGAEVPGGADAVVPVERAVATDGAVSVAESRPGANIRRAGEDVRAGDHVLEGGTSLGPAELAVLASLGRTAALCGRRPQVMVLATGDELVEPGEPLGPGQVHNSNGIAISAQAAQAGAEVVGSRMVHDDPTATTAALEEALRAADVVCVSGGVSVGPHDHVKPSLKALGVEERFWGVRLKPGKPTWFGQGKRALVFGLPGNPVSSMITFHLFARPALRRLAGAETADARTTAVADAALRRSPGRLQVVRCRLTVRADGWHVEPTKQQGSHILTSMLGAEAFALVAAGDGEIPAGDRVEVEILPRGAPC